MFSIYIFDERLRVDRKPGNIVFVVSGIVQTSVDKYGVPVIGYTEMLYKASKIYNYDSNKENYTIIKNRSGRTGIMVNQTMSSFIGSSEVIYLNDSVGHESTIGAYMSGFRTPAIMSDKKYCEISLAGMDNLEVYFTALADNGE